MSGRHTKSTKTFDIRQNVNKANSVKGKANSVAEGMDKMQPKNTLIYFLTVQHISTTCCTSRKQASN